MNTPRTVDDITAWLNQMEPIARVATCRLLAGQTTTAAIAAVADATVFAATRVAKYADVAEALGISERQVKRAVEGHRARIQEGIAG